MSSPPETPLYFITGRFSLHCPSGRLQQVTAISLVQVAVAELAQRNMPEPPICLVIGVFQALALHRPPVEHQGCPRVDDPCRRKGILTFYTSEPGNRRGQSIALLSSCPSALPLAGRSPDISKAPCVTPPCRGLG